MTEPHNFTGQKIEGPTFQESAHPSRRTVAIADLGNFLKANNLQIVRHFWTFQNRLVVEVATKTPAAISTEIQEGELTNEPE
jgi:hypothetical protein